MARAAARNVTRRTTGTPGPKKTEVKRLVSAHARLDEPMAAAIWIRRDDPTAWLVEVLPELPDDPRVDQPLVFTPTTGFRYALHLISGNKKNLEDALRKKAKLAEDVAEGEVLFEEGNIGKNLVSLARKVVRGKTG
jgi:hypothetical protein